MSKIKFFYAQNKQCAIKVLRKQEKPPPEGESVQLVKNLEEKQKEDLGNDNSPLFFIYI